MPAPGKFRLSTSRLSALFVAIFAAGITVLLTSVYILTARVLDHEVDVVIQAEVNGLIDDYRSGGVVQLIETLHRRADSWGRTGAVYLLVDSQGRRIAGNIGGWPTRISTSGQWIEFEIDASEHGGVIAHPVRAQVFQLPGGRSTDVNDYPVGKAAYAMRSVDAVLAKAKEKGVHIGEYVERLLAGPLPWTRMRQAYALVRLCDKYGDGRVEAVCQSALAFGVVDVSRVTRMVKAAAKPTAPVRGEPSRNVVQLTLPRFARPEQHFETRSSSKKEEGKS